MNLLDFEDDYKELVTFIPNKEVPIHRWYSFVEGYSTELVKKLINEQRVQPRICLDPFGGIGTTALTCSELGIDCISIEANPFFADAAKVKANINSYSKEGVEELVSRLERELLKCNGVVQFPELESITFFEDEHKKKWIFHKSSSEGVYDILSQINRLCINGSVIYRPLLTLSLASILLEVSNVFRNGKCLSYKRNWESRKYSRKQVHELFLNHLRTVVIDDINNYSGNYVDNTNRIILGDSRRAIAEIEEEIDLVITSPPYLNSRDYTDVYRLELWILGYISKFETEKKQRKKGLTSHVQIPIEKVSYPDVPELNSAISYLESSDVKLWNKGIPNMVRGYFNEMEKVIQSVHSRLTTNGRVYINVANSAYSNCVIEVDVILAKIAELNGFECKEIRVARKINTSSQQSSLIGSEKMRESIIVLEKV